MEDGEVFDDETPQQITGTWSYNSVLRDLDIEYAQYYCGGAKIEDVCPEEYKKHLSQSEAKIKSFIRAAKTAKINTQEFCLFDLIPEKHLAEYAKARNNITMHVLANYPKPDNHDFLARVAFLLDDISQRPITVDIDAVRHLMGNKNIRQFIKQVKRSKNSIHYDMFGTKTGRFTTNKNSFPILTFRKDCRSILKPQNDYFLELDYNAADLRTMMSLAGKQTTYDDFHEWLADNILGEISREQAKKEVFSWLYNQNASNSALESLFNRKGTLASYYDGSAVKTPYGRVIATDEEHALNHLVQSTTNDTVLNAAIKIDDELLNKKSFISFLMHDSIVLDLSHEDRYTVPRLRSLFEDTRFGSYLTNMTIGKDYGNMKELTFG
jgi:hypothetical protein